jgi:glutamate-1-semialdehyde 2,1-aminomutase
MTVAGQSSIYDRRESQPDRGDGSAQPADSGSGDADTSLRTRAARVIPGGMWGHQSVRYLIPSYPQFLTSARGARIVDADGREYVDLLCAYGPIVLGYQHPAVEAAAERQRQSADTMNAPSPLAVELAELLVDTIEPADWAILAKNGTDATTACVTIARAATGHKVVLAARGAYHGAAPWCSPNLAGVLDTDRAALRYFEYNDLASFAAAADAAGNDLAAVIITPMKHFEGQDQELVDVAFARAVRAACDRAGGALIIDDVRCGFRFHVGSSWTPIGVEPDLSAWSKALGNGYPVAAVTGSDSMRDAAASVYLTGSFWTSAVPMAAAIATITQLRQSSAFGDMNRGAARLADGIRAQAAAHSLTVAYTGHPTMPYLTFAADSDYERMNVFARACLDAHLYLHPRHNWFVSAAHTDDVVDAALAATDHAFSAVRSAFGAD